MLKKVLVCAQHVLSKNDGQNHFISANQLIALYGLNSIEHEIIIKPKFEHPRLEELFMEQHEDAIHIYPLYSGNYAEKKKELGL